MAPVHYYSYLVKFLENSYLFHLHVSRIRDCLTQLNAKDITPDDKQELDEALQREVCCLYIRSVTACVTCSS